MAYEIKYRVVGDAPPFTVTLHEDKITNPAVLTKTVTKSDIIQSFVDGGGYTISPFIEYCVKAVDSINKNVSICDVDYPIFKLTVLTNQSSVNVKYLNINENILNKKTYNIPVGENIVLDATPPQGYSFKNWETTPNTILNNSTNKPLNFSMIDSNFSIKPINEELINEELTNAFKFTIDTTKGSNFKFKLPLREGYNYDFTVDWGDGNTNTITSWDNIEKTHEYTTGESFQVSISGLCESISFIHGTAYKLISINQWGDVGFIDMGQAFYTCSNLTSVYDNNSDWSTNVTDMNGMFYQCSNLTDLNINNWNVSKVTDMSNMFYRCGNLTNLDVSGWNVSGVTNMSNMFYECGNLTDLNINNWDVSKVTNMSYLFYDCKELNVSELENWDISNVTNMREILHNVTLETPYYDNIINSWASLTPQNNVVFDANLCRRSSISCNAYFDLINDYNWTINDNSVTNFCTPSLDIMYNKDTNMIMYTIRIPYEGEHAYIKLTLEDGDENYEIDLTLENYYGKGDSYLIPHTPGRYIPTVHSEYGDYPVLNQYVDIYLE